MYNKESVYKDFIGKYQISKTLRFRLIPVGDTEKWIKERGILSADEKRAEDAKRVKEIIDDMHCNFIDDVLSNAEIDGWTELAEVIVSGDVSNIKTSTTEQRKKIVELFKKDDRYELLSKGKTAFVKNNLPDWIKNDYSDDDLEKVKSFARFTGYFDKLMQARQNMYSEKDQGTSIANRVVNENFLKFVANAKAIEKVDDAILGIDNKIDNCFVFAQYNHFLSQQGIESYNKQIGKINSQLNEAYQQKKILKKVKLVPLYKQILSDAEPVFRIDRLENDGELSEEIEKMFDLLLRGKKAEEGTEGIPIEKTIDFLENIANYEDEEILVDPKNLSILSRCLPVNRVQIMDALGISENSKKEVMLKDIVNTLKSSFDECKDLTVKFVIDNAKSQLEESRSKIFNLYKQILPVLSSYKGSEKKILLSKTDKGGEISQIKELLDEVKYGVEPFRDMFGNRHDENASLFQLNYNECNGAYNEFDKLYNLVRNYLTQKPYSIEKFKLTFDYSTLCDGWDINKEKDNKGIVLNKDGKFYLGVLNSKACLDELNQTSNFEDGYYEKLIFKTAGGASKQIPRIAFSSTWVGDDADLELEEIKKKKNSDRTKEEQARLIDYYQGFLKKYEWNEWFCFNFKNPEEYESMNEFNDDVDSQAYLVDFKQISSSCVDKAVSEGDLYLFQLYNKDFSDYSTGKKNLHTYYWKEVFSAENKAHGYPFELNGNAELFYRHASLEKSDIHKQGECLIDKTYTKTVDGEDVRFSIPDDVYEEVKKRANKGDIDGAKAFAKKELRLGDNEKIVIRECPHDIVKDKRYTKDQFNLHVPITINRTAPNPKNASRSINDAALELIKDNKNMHIIGIDRGERNLIYASVIDQEGRIVEQKNFNIVRGVDYHEKLDNKEKKRLDARRSWGQIAQIKDLKQGYLSQVVRDIVDMVIKYNGIVIMEELNFGFKTKSRAKFEKNVYQQFEKQLLDKLSYLTFKPRAGTNEGIWEHGGIAQGYQLVPKIDSLKNITGQQGCIFYVNSWNTSHIDPTTGFMNLFKFPKNTVDFWKDFFGRMGSIRHDEKGYFVFDFSYSKFKGLTRVNGMTDSWSVCSHGERFYNEKEDGRWVTKILNPTKEIESLLKKSGIEFADGHNLKDEICKMKKIKSFGWIFKQILNVRNSKINSEVDYILSPVKNSDGAFFDSREAKEGQPIDADANGAYNIALKGLLLVQRCQEQGGDKFKTAIKNEDWVKWVQDFYLRN